MIIIDIIVWFVAILWLMLFIVLKTIPITAGIAEIVTMMYLMAELSFYLLAMMSLA